MSLTYGFYNAYNHDRLYDAEDLSSIFDGIIRDGVYETYKDAMLVKPSSGHSIVVSTGRAWFNHTWTYIDAPYKVEVPSSGVLYDRIDAIVLKIDRRDDYRCNTIEVISGTQSIDPQKPEVDPNPDISVYQYVLAYVRSKAGVEAISAEDIENNIGTPSCPFVIGVLEILDASDIYAQWEDRWNQWFNTLPEDFMRWAEAHKREFEEWFDNLQYELDGDVAGHLQNEIDELKALWPIYYVPYTLYANQWTDNLEYSLESDFPSSRYNILNIYPPDNITADKYEKLLAVNLYGYREDNVLHGHDGEKPDEDITVVLQIIKKGVIT